MHSKIERWMNQKEDPFELGNELMKLYRKANPKEDPETEHAQRELIDTFCEALPSSIRIHVERAKPRNFDEAKNLALIEYHLKKRVFPENKNQKTPNANQNADKNRSPLLRNVSDFQPRRNFPAREQNMPSPRLPIFNPAPSVAAASMVLHRGIRSTRARNCRVHQNAKCMRCAPEA